MGETIGELVAKAVLDLKDWSTGIAQMQGDVEAFNSNIKGLGIEAGVTFAAMGVAMTDFVSGAGKQMGMMTGFTENFGQNSQKNLSILKAASKGTVDDFQLMQTANSGALIGVTTDINKMAMVMVEARLRGKEMGLDTATAFDELVNGIGRGAPRMLDQVGVKIPKALQDMKASMTDTQYTAALLNFVISDASDTYKKLGGDVLNSADLIAQNNTRLEEMKDALGSALAPVLTEVLNLIKPFVEAITSLANTNPQVIQQFVQVAGVVLGVITAFAIANKTIEMFAQVLALLRASINATEISMGLLGIALVVLSMLFAQAVGEQLDSANATDGLNSSMNDLVGTEGKAAKGANDMGSATADAIKKIREQIDQENQDYKQQLAQIVVNKNTEIQTNKDAIDKETKDFEKSMTDRKKTYDDQVKSQQDKNDQTLKDLETSLKQSLVVGSDHYQKDLDNYNQLVEGKKVEGDKLVQDLTVQYNEDTKNAQDQHDKKISDLQKVIDTDMAMLEKHAADIKGLNLNIAKDEIDTLKKTHEQKLAALNDELAKEKKATLGSASSTASSLKDILSNNKISWADMINPLDWNKVLDSMLTNLKAFLNTAWTTVKSVLSSLWDPTANKMAQFDTQAFDKDTAALKKKYANVPILSPVLKAFNPPTATGSLGSNIATTNKIVQSNTNATQQDQIVNMTFNQNIDQGVDIQAFNRSQAFILASYLK